MAKHLLLRLFAVMLATTGCGASVVSAQDTNQQQKTYCLQVIHTDGSELLIPFSQNPQFRHNGQALTLTSADLELEYPEGTLDRFKIVEQSGSNSVHPVFGMASAASLDMNGEMLLISNAAACASLTVCTTDGRIVAKATTDAEGSASVSLPASAGVYIISIDKTTFKILKK